jgi:NAD(P)-dependent dehydrogenase (short-subunit alcohol dehydrogenase family)
MADFTLPNASTDLSGQVALVTGATSGLGWRFAQVLASQGATVAISGRRVERMKELKANIENEGGNAVVAPVDMMDAEAILKMVNAVEAECGTINILVNNAGIPDAQLATKMSIELIDSVISVNLRGPFILASEIAKRLIKQKKPGRIINIASIAASFYNGNGAALYSVTKAGVARMAEALAVEWARFNINVNAIAPGMFVSEMTDGMFERMGGEPSAHTPRKRICDPAQLDSTLLYLCSPASDAVTGTVIKVDDGQSPR